MSDRTATILDAMRAPALFRQWFQDEATWTAWRAFLAALFHLPMDAKAQEIFRACTGRERLPEAAFNEAWLIVGRRGGKSLILALCAVFLALFRDWRQWMVPGEKGVVMVIAKDKQQAGVIFSYCEAFLQAPALRKYVDNVTRERIELVDGISIEVHPCSYRSIRGRTVICALCDELAIWDTDDAAEPDVEVLNALRPALGSVRGSVLLCASSSYARRGELWRAYLEHYGKDSPTLVWKAATRDMNPTYSQAVIDGEYRRDPSRAAAEFGSEFRSDAESYVSREVVEAVVVAGRHELAPQEGVAYFGFCDPAGGSGKDAFTLAISHHAGGQGVLDAVWCRRPPFSPNAVCQEFAALLRRYDVNTVEGDRYAGDWPAEGFQAHGISYRQCGQTKSELYQELLPALNSGQVVLLDQPHLVDELCGLERKTARGGRDSIDHVRGAHDDMANSAAGALVPAVRPLWNPSADDFWVADPRGGAGQVGALVAEGYSPAEARTMVHPSQGAPWSTRTGPGRPGPFIV